MHIGYLRGTYLSSFLLKTSCITCHRASATGDCDLSTYLSSVVSMIPDLTPKKHAIDSRWSCPCLPVHHFVTWASKKADWSQQRSDPLKFASKQATCHAWLLLCLRGEVTPVTVSLGLLFPRHGTWKAR